MSIFSINPLTTQNLDLTTVGGRKTYQAQIAQSLQQLQSVVAQLAANYSPSGPGINDFGTITTDQTWSVQGNRLTFLRYTSAVTQTRILTLSGFPQGGIILVEVNVTVGTLTFKMAATDTSGNAYTIQSWNTVTAAQTDLVGTGLAIGVADNLFFGMSGFVGTNASPRLNLYYV